MARPPADFSGFVGNRRVVALLERYARSSATQPVPHVLLIGPPGYGKSTLARALAKAVATKLFRVTGAARPDAVDVLKVLIQLKYGDVLYLDEAHLLPRAVQDLLLGALGEDRMIPRLLEQDGTASISSGEVQSVPQVTAIFATDQPGRLLPALRSRTPLVLDMVPYTLPELREICHRVSEQHALAVKPQALTLLAKAAHGIPRRAVQLIELLCRFRSGSEPVDKAGVRSFLVDHGIDQKHMLTSIERNYVLLLNHQSRPTSIKFLARLLGVDVDFLGDTVEARLRRDGFVEISPSGRQLTAAGQRLARELAKSLNDQEENIDEDQT